MGARASDCAATNRLVTPTPGNRPHSTQNRRLSKHMHIIKAPRDGTEMVQQRVNKTQRPAMASQVRSDDKDIADNNRRRQGQSNRT